MKLLLCAALALVGIVVLSGCTAIPTGPVIAAITVDEKGPVAVGDMKAGMKVGMAQAEGILVVSYGDASIVAAMKEGLASQGWVEGKNVIIDIRYAVDSPGKAPSVIKELLALKPDVFILVGNNALAELESHTTAIPVILCDEWTDAQVKAFRILVNRSATWADFDDEFLSLEFAGTRRGRLRPVAHRVRSQRT